MKKFLISLITQVTSLLIDFYQTYLSFDRGILMFLAPGGACKSAPTCSEYTKQSIQRFGVYKGVLSGLKRLWRCR